MTDPLEYLKGKMAAELQAEEAEADPVTAAEPEIEEAPEPEVKAKAEPEAPTGDIEKARAAIERKFKALAPTLLDKMSEAQILAMGVQIAADLKQYGDLANERDRLKKTTEQSTDRHEEEETEQGAPKGTRPSEPEQMLELSEILGSLDADLYEGLPETLTKAFNAIQKRANDGLKAGLESSAREHQSTIRDLVDSDVRRELADRFPSLRDPDVAASLRDTMKLLEPGMTYPESMDIRDRRLKLMETALVIVDPNAVVESQGKPSQRERGGPQPPKKRGKPAALPSDPNAMRMKYLQLRTKGYSVERAKADSGLLAEG